MAVLLAFYGCRPENERPRRSLVRLGLVRTQQPLYEALSVWPAFMLDVVLLPRLERVSC